MCASVSDIINSKGVVWVCMQVFQVDKGARNTHTQRGPPQHPPASPLPPPKGLRAVHSTLEDRLRLWRGLAEPPDKVGAPAAATASPVLPPVAPKAKRGTAVRGRAGAAPSRGDPCRAMPGDRRLDSTVGACPATVGGDVCRAPSMESSKRAGGG